MVFARGPRPCRAVQASKHLAGVLVVGPGRAEPAGELLQPDGYRLALRDGDAQLLLKHMDDSLHDLSAGAHRDLALARAKLAGRPLEQSHALVPFWPDRA